MRAIGLVLACLALASHTHRVPTSVEQAQGSLNDEGEDSQWLVEERAASAASLSEVKQSLLRQKVGSLSLLRKLAILLLALNQAAAFQLPGASRAFSPVQHGHYGRAPLQRGHHGRVVMQAGGAGADRETDETAPVDDMWQFDLDKALLDLDLEPRERLELLQNAINDPSLLDDVRVALSSFQFDVGLAGNPEAIEKLFPSGTQSRADLEGLTALRKQLPEAFEELQKQVQEQLPKLFEEVQKQVQESPTRDSSARPSLPDPISVIKSLASLAIDEEKQRELQEEAKNLLRSTPKGLETPSYEVARVLEGPIVLGKPQPVEIRDYEEFTVAQTNMKEGIGSASEGGGFNTLAAYLFGQNQGKTAMAMTVPVDTVSGANNGRASMSFVLPKEFADSPPKPLEGSAVEIVKVPARLVAAKQFSGLVTEPEVERQKAALLDALAIDGNYAPVDVRQVSVLQYNQPLAIPWRRRNEVAIVVTEWAAADRNMDYPDNGMD